MVAVLLYISFVQYKRADNAIQAASNLLDNMNIVYDYIREATEQMGNSQLKQAFEADDEVGFFFKELQNIQETLATFVPHEETVADVE